LNKFGLGVIG